MCGISFTYCNSEINYKTRLSSIDLYQSISKKLNKTNLNINSILDKTIQYKTDCNFLNFFKSDNERKYIYKSIKLLKKKKFEREKRISDAIWFLEEELNDRYLFVKDFLNKKSDYKNCNIIFFKTLNSIINSINIQEIRGRDSMGLMISLHYKKNGLDILSFRKKFKNKNYNLVENKNYFTINFIYKTYNVFGSLRDNSRNIIESIKKDKNLLNVLFNFNFDKTTFVAHTRWASSGNVNLNNTHPADNKLERKKHLPIVYTFMNGDINNYQNIIQKLKNEKKILIHEKINDTRSLSCFLGSDTSFFDKSKILNKLNKLNGSFASFNISTQDMSKILLIKKGKQGMYVGKNSDRYFFSSDIYGLVEDCDYVSSIYSNSFSFFDLYENNKILFNNFKNTLKNKLSFKKVNITSQDVSKRNFEHYMKKEILESKNVLNKTITIYLKNIYKSKLNTNYNFIKKIKNKKINKIIITGMGTCYTAALIISNYMKEQFDKNGINIDVSAIMAAEGSIFNIQKDMSNILIIVIAQSGTTKDTNVFADIAKRRGASTISFLNKRGGDISFLVDETFYIGDGRDIEMAVPSTKTYFAHIALGQIFTQFLIKQTLTRKQINQSEIKNIKKLPYLISKTIKNFHLINLRNVFNKFSKNKRWFISYDSKITKYISEETRIKMSECCYKTVSTIHLNDLINLDIKNSCIIANLNSTKAINKKIKILINKNNTVLLISSKNSLNKIGKLKNLLKIPVENVNNNYLSYTSVIITQLISYELAKYLNLKKKFFEDIQVEIKINSKNKKNLDLFLRRKSSCYNIISIKEAEIIKLRNLLLNYLKNKKAFKNKCINHLNLIINLISRPIDTIKHQAKTITVGTERVSALKKKDMNSTKGFKLDNKGKRLTIVKNNVSELILGHITRTISDFSNLNKKDIKLKIVDNLKKKLIQRNENFLILRQENKSFDKIEFSYSYNGKIRKHFLQNKYIDIKTNSYLKNIINISQVVFQILNKLFHTKKYLQSYFDNILNDLNSLRNFKDKRKLFEIKKNSLSNKNFKILANTQNKNSSKILSLLLGKYLKTTCSFDILENHKHIDISSEPFLIAIVTDINNKDYKLDALSEFQKFEAHNNKLLIITNKNDTTFDNKLNNAILLKLPNLKNKFNLIMTLGLFQEYLQ